MKKKTSLDIYDVYKSVRKPMPPPTTVRKDKRETRRDFKEYLKKDKWKYE